MATAKKKTAKKGTGKRTTKKTAAKTVKKKTGKKKGARAGTGRSGAKKPARKRAARKDGLKPAPAHTALSPDRLCWRCDPDCFRFKDTSTIRPLGETVGQDRAVRAIELGVSLRSPGYNIYVSGQSGTGKMTTVTRILDQARSRCRAPRDFAYVYNFKNSYQPLLLVFPKGGGIRFHRRMDDLVRVLRKELPATLEGGTFAEQRETLAEAYIKKQKGLFVSFEEELKKNGFILSQIRMGAMSRPEIMIPVGDKAFSVEQLAILVETGQIELPGEVDLEAMKTKEAGFRKRMREVMKTSRRLNAELAERLERLERRAVSDLIGDIIADIQEEFADNEKVCAYLADLTEHILTHLTELKAIHNQEKEPRPLGAGNPGDPYLPYRVNVILDNSGTDTCSIVKETNPTYNNVFGTIERTVTHIGQTVTDFTKIKAGSILQADGGFLVLNAVDALSEPGLWKTLKRVLMHRELVIQGIEGLFQLSTVSLKPEPIRLETTVILIGPPYLYFLLHQYDEDFRKIFKVRADFDQEIRLNEEAVQKYASFVARMCDREGLRPFRPEAVARLIEHGVRAAGGRERVTSHFGEIADVIRESSFWAEQSGRKRVSGEAVERALRGRRDRIDLVEEKVRDRYREGLVLIDTGGSRVGQVNGLAVLAYGEHRFGIPSRITAAVGVGKAGIVNVEREAKLSGNTHDKGVLILTGYLRENFARKSSLGLTASICFEQSYGGVDGDSASSTELYAILSAIAGVPIRQDLAVSGSVNQKGDVQAVGGINEKVEGFFALCNERGLTGEQGVLIPESNVPDLMLREEVRRAVEKGSFHIYPISRIEQGIGLLTGAEAGEPNEKGEWPKGTLYARIQERLRELEKGSAPVRRRGARKKK
ncbi:MAG: AAA family ATPase [Candidatus Eisenbacteria bacterium]|nr:AAA family ATPase [Candidatus Eisenbacteria bacterium]